MLTPATSRAAARRWWAEKPLSRQSSANQPKTGTPGATAGRRTAPSPAEAGAGDVEETHAGPPGRCAGRGRRAASQGRAATSGEDRPGAEPQRQPSPGPPDRHGEHRGRRSGRSPARSCRARSSDRPGRGSAASPGRAAARWRWPSRPARAATAQERGDDSTDARPAEPDHDGRAAPQGDPVHADRRASRGARAPKTANARTGSEVSRPAVSRRHAEAVAHLGQDRSHAHCGRAQVEREQDQAGQDPPTGQVLGAQWLRSSRRRPRGGRRTGARRRSGPPWPAAARARARRGGAPPRAPRPSASARCRRTISARQPRAQRRSTGCRGRARRWRRRSSPALVDLVAFARGEGVRATPG